MNNIQSFEEFLAISGSNIPLSIFFLNILMAVVLSSILRWIYIQYGTSLSNRRMFAKNFVIISLTTMVIITIVKSSLALSLGLVGALSIVRFRAAIKEPEELSYLFLAIAIGLGFGANQFTVTVVGFIVITLVIIANNYFSSKSIIGELKEDVHLFLKVTSNSSGSSVNLEKVINLLSDRCIAVDLKRLDQSEGIFEASFLIEVDNSSDLTSISDALTEIEPTIEISFIDYNQPI